MKKLLYSTLIIFVFSASISASTNKNHQEYLAKLILPVGNNALEAFTVKSMDSVEHVWLNQVDGIFETAHLSKLDASFALSFARDGSIDHLSLLTYADNINEADFKSLVAKLLTIKVPSPPATIAADSFFVFDANWLYLDRPTQNPIVMNASYSDTTISTNNDFEQIYRLIRTNNSSVQTILEYPTYIDYPYLGEIFKFKLKDHPEVILKGYVEKLNDDYLQIKIEEISNPSNKLITDLTFNVDRSSLDFRALSAKMLETAISSAASAGIAGASLTNGIMPGAFAVLGASAVLAQEHAEEKPFYLNKGDEVVLKIGGDTNERNIDLWSISSGDNWSVSTSDPGFTD